jgi:hypothetical protein
VAMPAVRQNICAFLPVGSSPINLASKENDGVLTHDRERSSSGSCPTAPAVGIGKLLLGADRDRARRG